ncbi:MAG: Protein of unknown function (DUF1553)/Planctomycete cytochrome C [Verrucomicrobia bacterium]|nr:MAG: Protein of unknown function (DUF1553)/Planctomycete cytochrome C [Verrucomicrobiota bacterium]
MSFARVLAVALAPLFFATDSFGEEKVRFNKDVRPILSDTCFHCHGPDEKERKGGLRLDLRAEALKPAKSGATAIVPGKPEQSEIITRILSEDSDEVMPPNKLHKNLTAAQRKILRNWVEQGAEYEGHWAFIGPVRSEPPLQTGNPIDAFLRVKLAAAGMQPCREASREALIRRVTLDLTGLPPAPADVAAFLADRHPDAYARVVDRLLASPAYGEHMASPWLDLARYADSNGFQSDTSREMWHWRDWLIAAFNRNLPFDQFTIEQLAGDMLPNATKDQILATGFNRNHRLNGEGGRIVEEWFAETVIDRVETTGLTWMALTFNCCRCHDHKYDPVTQKEFYQLFSYFNSSDETGVLGEFGGSGSSRKGGNTQPVLFLPTEEEKQQLASLERETKTAEKQLTAARKELPAGIAAWEKDFLAKIGNPGAAWKTPEVLVARSLGGATLTAQPDGSYLAGGKNPANDSYEIVIKPEGGQFTGLLLEVLPDASLPGGSLGRSGGGNFVLTGVEIDVHTPGVAEPVGALLTRAEADYEQKSYEVAKIVEGQAKPTKGKRPAEKKTGKVGWAVDGADPTKKVSRKALFVCEPIELPEGASLTVRLVHASSFGDHNLGRFKLQTSSIPPSALSLKGGALSESLKTALQTEPAKRSAAQRVEIEKFYIANTSNAVRQAESQLAELRKKFKETTDSQHSSMVMKEVSQPRPAFILTRGEYDKPAAEVPRALPSALPPLPEGASNDRLGLAKWLVSGEHPLTARVWVNRAWERLFGTGIVKTTENFGSQAEWPSHPELLDWLATEFVRLNWDMKAMQRLFVTSETYRQSSAVSAEHLAKDPENRLLGRMPRLRLSAETLRDQALTVSGLLVDQIGGPSVRPYMPDAVWDETSVYGNLRNYQADSGEGLYRRTLYTIWKRTAAPPSMLLFDSPSREICTVKRGRSNTPTQALALLNEVTYVEAARRLAEGMLLEGGATPEARVEWAFQRVLARKPDAFERATVTSRLKARLEQLLPDEAAARKMISVGNSKPVGSLVPGELAAYTVTANVLLNLDETVSRP